MTTKLIENVDLGRDLVREDILTRGVWPIDAVDAGGVYCYQCQAEHPFEHLRPLTARSGVFTDLVRCDMDAAVWVCLEHTPFSTTQFEAFTPEVRTLLSGAKSAG